MQINRNNYEDFFLLYADRELRADECKAVDDFVAENEDLRIELEMLQAAVLPFEEMTFIDKSFLYKETIFDKELQEKLLLKLDNELEANELNNINASILNNELIKKEYELLLKTKLDNNDIIVFEEKQLLYKKEKGKVVSFGWLKWTAAAIFIGFALFTGVDFFNKTNKPEVIGIAKKPARNNTKKIEANTVIEQQSIANTTSTNKKEIVTNNESSATVDEIKPNENLTAKKENIAKKEKVNLENKEIYNKEGIENKNEIETLQQKNNFIAKEELKLPIEKEVSTMLANNLPIKAVGITTEDMVPLEETYSKAIAISNTEKSENKILYLNEDDVKKTKVGGFFRKIKRIVERTANIKPGNSLQIAGFEIASK